MAPKNTWSPLLEMLQGPVLDAYPGLEPLEGFVNLPRAGRIEPITSSARTIKGNRPIFAVLDQSEEWVRSNRGTKLAETIRINAETQAKLGRMDVSETALFNEAFSLDDPKDGAPRLRLMKDDGGKTYQNLHRGARAFADGLYTAIRNPGMHMPPQSDGGEEQLALEQLAAFSLLARWIDQSEIEKVGLSHDQVTSLPCPQGGLEGKCCVRSLSPIVP